MELKSDIMEFLSKRASVRNFSQKNVPDELLEKILSVAMHAPTTGNMQLYSVVITRNDDNKKKLSPCHFNQPASLNAKVLVTFCADFNRFVKWCEINNANPGFDNFQSFLAAVFDTTILAQQFCAIAECNGLGTCYLGTTTYNAPEIARLLELPERVVPVLTVAIGYPQDQSTPSDKLPVRSFIHYEKYSDYNEEDIKSLYGYKDQLEENKIFIKENSKENLAQVFTDIRYPKSTNETFSSSFIDYIKDLYL